MALGLTDLIVFCLFMGAVVAVSLYAGRKEQRARYTCVWKEQGYNSGQFGRAKGNRFAEGERPDKEIILWN